MESQLPYYKEPNQIPGYLPSIHEIHAATITLPTNISSTRIVVIENKFVVKYGPYVPEIEGFNLLFVERMMPSIPSPRLYAMFREAEMLYLVMDYLPGKTLSSLWPTLSIQAKKSITHQLRGILDKMRSVPAPQEGEFFASLRNSRSGNGWLVPCLLGVRECICNF